MGAQQERPPETGLDPEDWQAFEAQAQAAMAEVIKRLEHVREEPVWIPMDETVRGSFVEPLPRQGQGLEPVLATFFDTVWPYRAGHLHPRFWGWVTGQGTPVGMLADMLAAALDSNVAAFDQSTTEVELAVVNWFLELYGMPEGASGVMVSGGSEANLVGLAAARHAKSGSDVRRFGMHQGEAPMVFYTSDQAHFSIEKSLQILGVGAEFLRKIPSRDDFSVDVAAMGAQIRADRDAGLRPVCIAATAGSVNVGAVDPLDALADLARDEGLWLHVDGAFGALLALSDEHRHRLAGIERADSIAFDLHKWMYQPYECACALVRDGEVHGEAFSFAADYLTPDPGSVGEVRYNPSRLGVQLSRGFKALKAWMAFKVHGAEHFGRVIAQNIAQARYLSEKVEADPRLELMAPTGLNIVNLRIRREGMDEAALEEFNRRTLVALQRSGVAVASSTFVRGRFTIRLAFCNHRTRRADIDLFLDELLKIAEKQAEAGA